MEWILEAEGVAHKEIHLLTSHRGKHISYQRGKRNTTPGTSLLKLEGVDNTESAQWYCGKRVAYVYRAQRSVRGSKIRVIWGKVTRPHGS